MNGVVRFLELVNAAIWLGASLFFTIGVAPAVFSDEMRTLLQHPYFPGAVAQILFSRFFVVQYCCAAIALLSYAWEAIYRGRKFDRLTVGILVGLLTVTLIGGLWLQPKLKSLHGIRYSAKATPAQQEEAKKVFGPLHGTSQVINLGVLAGLFFYFWKLTSPPRSSTTNNPFGWK